jgi:hypothetical protein
MSKRVWLTATGLIVGASLFGAVTISLWTISETHFDRPDEGFDLLATELEALPGVGVDQKERWVEAPTFSGPTSWISITVEKTGLPGLLDAACATDYSDTVNWSLRVTTDRDNVVSVHSGPMFGDAVGSSRCTDFGFDVAGVVDGIDSSVSGMELQAAIWEDNQFALVALEDPSEGLEALLPLVAHADDVRNAAGLDPDRVVEIDAPTLSLVIEPGENERYFAVLTTLAEEHGVTSYAADGGGTPTDGVEKVQIVGGDENHTAIEDAIRTSGLHIADFPVRFR